MKSAVFYGKHDLRVEDQPMPQLGPQDVLIQVKACGVCGTDVHFYEGDEGAAAVTPPTILGHEFSGIVAAVGSDVTACRVGDRVCIDPIHEDAKAVLDANGMTRINTVIECVGKPATIQQGIQLAGHKALVMMFGLTKPEETIDLKPFEVFKKELTLKASYINPYTQQRALDLIDSGRLDVSSMIYEVSPLEKLADILSNPQLRAKGKYVISPEL